jgi:hypothetical protein
VHAIYLTAGQGAYRPGIRRRTLPCAVHRGAIIAAYQIPAGFFRYRYADGEAYARWLASRSGILGPGREQQSQPIAGDR